MTIQIETGKITIRREVPADFQETENLVREAFWDLYRPGCVEHLLVHKLRESPAFVKELDFVACDQDKVVGFIACSTAKIKRDQGQECTVLSLIVGVLPSYQQKGIGSSLIQRVIAEAQRLGFPGIVLFGSPGYYSRFGFKNAKEYRIQTSEGINLDPFMALELSEQSLKGINGRFYEDPAYDVGPEEVELFDKAFPHKEKHVTDTQLK